MKKLIVVIVIVIAVIAGFFIWKHFHFELEPVKIFEADGLVQLTYSYGGGEDGAMKVMEITRVSEEEAILDVFTRENYAARQKQSRYHLDVRELEYLQRIIDKYRLDLVPSRGYEEVVVLDAGSGHLKAEYGDGSSFGYSALLEMHPRHHEGTRLLISYLNYLAGGEKPQIPEDSLQLVMETPELPQQELLFMLYQSTAAHELIAQMPQQIDLQKYGSNENIFYPRTQLDCRNLESAEGGSGVLAYYEPWGDVVIFYDEFMPAEGLYKLGELMGTCELADLQPGNHALYNLRKNYETSDQKNGN